MILIFYLIICLSFKSFTMDLSLSLHMITPIGHMEVTDHMFVPLYPYIIYG